jgi:cytochrome c-type biogenesis protein CcmH/NrfG
MLESMGATRQAAAAWRQLGDLYRDLGRVDDAVHAYDRALRAVRIAPVTIQSVGAQVIQAGARPHEDDLAST